MLLCVPDFFSVFACFLFWLIRCLFLCIFCVIFVEFSSKQGVNVYGGLCVVFCLYFLA